MIHYTPFPAEWVWCDTVSSTEQYTVQWQGVPLVVQWDAERGATIVQLLSCDPQHYLDPRLQPGMSVEVTLPAH
jgi:hypothetical protein